MDEPKLCTEEVSLEDRYDFLKNLCDFYHKDLDFDDNPLVSFENNPVAKEYKEKGLNFITNTNCDDVFELLQRNRKRGYTELVVDKRAFDIHGRIMFGMYSIYGKKD